MGNTFFVVDIVSVITFGISAWESVVFYVDFLPSIKVAVCELF